MNNFNGGEGSRGRPSESYERFDGRDGGPGEPSRWQRFLDFARSHPAIKPQARPHYARWVSDWLTAGAEASEEATRKFFEELGRRRTFKDWQFRQAVRAVRAWAVDSAWLPSGARFDWQGLADQAIALEDEHRTVLRERIAAEPETPSLGDYRREAPGEPEAVNAMVAELRKANRLGGLAAATEKTYAYWAVRFGRFRMRCLGRECLRDLDPADIARYLEYLALRRKVSPATQKQALNARVFLARMVHNLRDFELNYKSAVHGARRLPAVLTRAEVDEVIAQLDDPWKLICEVSYGAGLRQAETLRLRVKDVDFGQGTIIIHDGKGGKHRVAPLPRALEGRLRLHLDAMRKRHEKDCADGLGTAHLPESLRRKLPNAPREWPWQWLFPAAGVCAHPGTGEFARYHLHEKSLQRQFTAAVRRAAFHSLRHSFATHLLGHSDVSTTMIYLHVMRKPGAGAPSPLGLPR